MKTEDSKETKQTNRSDMKKGTNKQSVSLEFLGLLNFFVCPVLYFTPRGKDGNRGEGAICLICNSVLPTQKETRRTLVASIKQSGRHHISGVSATFLAL